MVIFIVHIISISILVSYKGGMSDNQKKQVVSDFRNKADIYVFLGTFKAVGVGLTLTEASYVIHFDHWWNPAVMKQAEDRAHRIGQENKLTVYSFWGSCVLSVLN